MLGMLAQQNPLRVQGNFTWRAETTLPNRWNMIRSVLFESVAMINDVHSKKTDGGQRGYRAGMRERKRGHEREKHRGVTENPVRITWRLTGRNTIQEDPGSIIVIR